MSDQSAFQGQPEITSKSSNKKRLLILFLVVFILIIAGLAGLYYLGMSPGKNTNATNPKPTGFVKLVATIEPTATASISATPKASPSAAEINDITIQVLNGSGVGGVAQKIATQVTQAGYAHVTTGNASTFAYQGLTILYTKTAKASANMLEKELTIANPDTKITAKMDDTISSDIQVIVGK